jgi:hypothetical protein
MVSPFMLLSSPENDINLSVRLINYYQCGGNGSRFPPTLQNVLKMNEGRSRNGSLTNSKKAHHSLGILLLLITSATTLRGHPAITDDAERLAECIATADVAAAAVKSRDRGISPQRARQVIASADATDAQLKEAIAIAYDGADQRTPEQASRKVIHNCLEAE